MCGRTWTTKKRGAITAQLIGLLAYQAVQISIYCTLFGNTSAFQTSYRQGAVLRPTMKPLTEMPRSLLLHAFPSRPKQIQSLISWAKDEAKIQIGSMDLRTDSYLGLGWFAASDLPANTVLLSVPVDRALSVEAPGSGPDDRDVLKLIQDRSAFRELPWYVQMSCYLYKLDKIDPSKGGFSLQSWIQSLPREMDTPIHWTREDRTQLQYKYLTDNIEKQEKEWRSYYEQLVGCASDIGISWEEFLWGCEMARSRAFSGGFTGSGFNPSLYLFTLILVGIYVGLGVGSIEQAANGAGVVFCAIILQDFVLPKLFKSKRYVICPMVDMANHRSMKYQGKVSFEYFANSYSLASDEKITQDSEVCISYGSRSNDQLLQYYGFVESGNPHDVYVLPPLREWNIDEVEKATGRKFQPGRLGKLEKAGLLGGSRAENEDDMNAPNAFGGVVITRVTGVDPAILQALRALVSTEAEWEAAGESIGNFATKVSDSNEAAANAAAKRAMELELEAKPTTLDEDKNLLNRMMKSKAGCATPERLVLEFRIEKKALLKSVIDSI